MSEHCVDKWATVTVMGSHYSVPDNLVGKRVSVRLYSEKVSIFHEGKKVSAHERSYRQGTWSLRLENYTDTFLHKPGALKGSLALKQAEKQIGELYSSYFQETPRDFVRLIQYMDGQGFSAAELLQACRVLKDNGIRHITLDQMKLQMHSGKNTGNGITDHADISCVIAANIAQQAMQIEKESISTLDSITDLTNKIQPENQQMQ